MGKRAEYDSQAYDATKYDGELAWVLKSEFSERFADAMRNRMIVSFYKYGLLAANCPEKTNTLASLEKRIAKYRETGNAEWLVDVANFAMMEFMHPTHEAAHFRGTDSSESPGLVAVDGSVVHAHTASAAAVAHRFNSRRDGD